MGRPNGSRVAHQDSEDYNALFRYVEAAHLFGEYHFKVRDGKVYRIEFLEGFEDVAAATEAAAARVPLTPIGTESARHA